jgi:hypothetical protein
MGNDLSAVALIERYAREDIATVAAEAYEVVEEEDDGI